MAPYLKSFRFFENTVLAFRIHHAVTDGMGLMDLSRSIFQAVNHQQPERIDSKITVEKMPPCNLKAIPPKMANAALPCAVNKAEHPLTVRSRVWKRISIPGKDHNILL